jgi:hypothetical protein
MKQASVSSAVQGGGKRRGAWGGEEREAAQRQNAPPATPEAARGRLALWASAVAAKLGQPRREGQMARVLLVRRARIIGEWLTTEARYLAS